MTGSSLTSLVLPVAAIAMADRIDHHLRPPAIAVAIAGHAVGRAVAVRRLQRHRFEIGEFLGLRIETQGAVGRPCPDHALPSQSTVGGAAGRPTCRGRDEDLDLVGLRIEPAEAAMIGLHGRARIEPENAVRVARDPVRVDGEAVRSFDLQRLHHAGLGVDPADRHAMDWAYCGEDEIAVEIGPGVMDHIAERRGGSEHPVGAVVGRGALRPAGIRIDGNVIFLEDDARRFARRARLQIKFHRRGAGPARAGEIGGQFLLV